MGTQVTIRLADELDIADCIKLGTSVTFMYRANVMKAIETGTVYIALYRGTPVGLCMWKRTRSGECKIDVLAVRKTYQGQGIGRALLERVAHEAGSTVVLTCPADIDANGFYAHLGFTLYTKNVSKRGRVLNEYRRVTCAQDKH